MPNNTPEKLLVISAEPTNQWGKQKIMVQNATRQQYQLHLGAKSGKMPAGQLNTEQLFEVWPYKTPKGVDMMCGSLCVPNAPSVLASQTMQPPEPASPANLPVPANWGTPTAPPVNKDRLIVAQVVYKEFSAHCNALEDLMALNQHTSEMQWHVNMIFDLANPLNHVSAVPSEGKKRAALSPEDDIPF